MKKYLFCVCAAIGFVNLLRAAEPSRGFPKISFTYDFNAPFSDQDASGPRVAVYSNHKYFGKDKNRNNANSANSAAYAYGLGFGGYSIDLPESMEDNYLYHVYALLILSYHNPSRFEPFAALYPGYAWGTQSGFFANPTAGMNVTLFSIRRNWNSELLSLSVQLRAEYNTLLSSAFLGGGVILQF